MRKNYLDQAKTSNVWNVVNPRRPDRCAMLAKKKKKIDAIPTAPKVLQLMPTVLENPSINSRGDICRCAPHLSARFTCPAHIVFSRHQTWRGVKRLLWHEISLLVVRRVPCTTSTNMLKVPPDPDVCAPDASFSRPSRSHGSPEFCPLINYIR